MTLIITLEAYALFSLSHTGNISKWIWNVCKNLTAAVKWAAGVIGHVDLQLEAQFALFLQRTAAPIAFWWLKGKSCQRLENRQLLPVTDLKVQTDAFIDRPPFFNDWFNDSSFKAADTATFHHTTGPRHIWRDIFHFFDDGFSLALDRHHTEEEQFMQVFWQID